MRCGHSIIFVVMTTLFYSVYSIWLVSEIALNRMLRAGGNDRPNKDRHSLLIIWITIIVAVVAAICVAGIVALPVYASAAFQYISLGIILLGVIIRLAVVVSLGKFFTVDVTIRQGHRLKKDGFYSKVRHPSYAASLLSFIGFGISLNNWLSLLLITAAVTAVFIYRINIEEQVLTEQFGDEYIAYKKRTKRLIPFVY